MSDFPTLSRPASSRLYWARRLLAPFCVLALLAACEDEPASKVCDQATDYPGAECDVEGQTCSFGDADCVYKSECVDGTWSNGVTTCQGGAGGQAAGGGGGGGGGSAGAGG